MQDFHLGLSFYWENKRPLGALKLSNYATPPSLWQTKTPFCDFLSFRLAPSPASPRSPSSVHLFFARVIRNIAFRLFVPGRLVSAPFLW